MPLGPWCMIPSLILASMMKSHFLLFLKRNLCRNPRLGYDLFNKWLKSRHSPSVCCSAGRRWVLPSYLRVEMPTNSSSCFLVVAALWGGVKAAANCPWSGWLIRFNGGSRNSLLHILCAALELAVDGGEQTQKIPWPVVAVLQLMEHRSTGRQPCTLQCYLQMIKVAA